MSIDPETETLLSLMQVAERLDVHPMTARRWHAQGVAGVQLETVKVGGRRFTSDAALRRFLEEVNRPPQEGRSL